MQLRFPLQRLGPIWETITSRESILLPDVRKASPTSCCHNAPGLGQGTWLAHRGPDVLVEREEVGWIIRVLESDQPFVVDAIGCPHPLFSLVAQEVDVDLGASKRL